MMVPGNVFYVCHRACWKLLIWNRNWWQQVEPMVLLKFVPPTYDTQYSHSVHWSFTTRLTLCDRFSLNKSPVPSQIYVNVLRSFSNAVRRWNSNLLHQPWLSYSRGMYEDVQDTEWDFPNSSPWNMDENILLPNQPQPLHEKHRSWGFLKCRRLHIFAWKFPSCKRKHVSSSNIMSWCLE